MFILVINCFVDEKVRRLSSDSKKNLGFFSSLYGQPPHLRTNCGKQAKKLSKEAPGTGKLPLGSVIAHGCRGDKPHCALEFVEISNIFEDSLQN
jgi:hypothetical protein